MSWSLFLRKSSTGCKSKKSLQRGGAPSLRRRLVVERFEDRTVPTQLVDTTLSPTELATLLVGPGVSVENVTFTGGAASTGSFSFSDPAVVGFGQGIVLSSGNAGSVVGPNVSDTTSTDFALPGDANLTALSGFDTFDAAVLEFDFIPTANQVVFKYAFASDEYPEWVSTPYNDVFAFFVNGTNYADVRQIAGDPSAPFVPVAVNNINNSNPVLDPPPTAMRPDLFRSNYYNPSGPSAFDFELDGITSVLTFQAPVNPGVVNHMKLAIADASDGIYDSAVFIETGSLVSNENPVADLSLTPSTGAAPLFVTAVIEGEDPNGLPLTYSINWGDGTFSNGSLTEPAGDSEKTALVDHTFTGAGTYYVTLTVSNGTLSGTSTEDVDVSGVTAAPVVTSHPAAQIVFEDDLFTFSASASGAPEPTVQWQVSTDAGVTFIDVPGATATTYSATASLADDGNLYRAVFTNSEDSDTTNVSLLTVTALDTTPPLPPSVALTEDTGSSATDNITRVGTLILSGVETDASVEYSIASGIWSSSFSATEGLNTVSVRQTDAAGNVSDVTTFSFRLDTVPPVLHPAFSSAQPFLVKATGITVSANATDASGIASEVSGLVVTSSPGHKFVTCTATDNAGNNSSVDVPYVVGYRAINVLPLGGATFKRTASIPVSFQLVDANGRISDQTAASLLPSSTVVFGGQAPVSVKYNKKTDTFSATLKTNKLPVGFHDVFIHIGVYGADVTTVIIPVKLV